MKRIVFIIALFAAAMPAQAASFDCGKARTTVEHLICADPAVSHLDDQLAAAYAAARKSLSPEGRSLLKQGQLEWIRYLNVLCSDATCLKTAYKDRLEALQGAVRRIGPYTFSRVDHYYAKQTDKDEDMYQAHVAYPRIDSPQSDAAKKWNALVVTPMDKDGCDGDWGDFDASFEIKSATARAISVQNSHYVYCSGAAHGMPGQESVTYILSPSPRLIKAADLFKPGKAWKRFVTGKCMKALNAKAGEDGDVDEAAVEKIVASPKFWTLTDKGLLVTFNPYAVLPYAMGFTDVLIPWAELRPYLAPDAPIPVKQAAKGQPPAGS